jgi:tetratricopeptide (TPR) repeat protein
MATALPVIGQESPRPGDSVIITAESAPIFAYPDENSTIIAVHHQGYVDRMGPSAANGNGWAYLSVQGGYVRLDESGLMTRTDALQQELLEAVTTEIEQNPDDLDAFIRRGTIYTHMRDYEAAIEDYTHAIELDPNHGKTYALRGWVLRQMHQLTRSIEDYEQAISLGETGAWTLIGAGVSSDSAYLNADAYRWYQQAIEQHPDAPYAYNNLGILYKRELNYDRAFEYYNRVTAINPYIDAPYQNRALIYRDQNNYDAALAELNTAVKQNPYNPENYISLAILYAFFLDDSFTALDRLDKALSIDPEYSNTYEARALVYAYEAGDAGRAVADFATAIRLDPYNESAISRAGIFYARIGQFDLALDYYDWQATFEPLTQYFYLYRAQIYYCLGDYPSTKQDVSQALNVWQAEFGDSGALSWAYLVLGMTALQEGDYTTAYENYNMAFLSTPEWTRDWQSIRGLRVIDSRALLAQRYVQRIERDPNDADNYLQLAHIMMEFGSWKEAIGYYRQYLNRVDNADLEEFVDMIESHLEAN